MCPRSQPTTTFHCGSTVSTHSVSSRRVSHDTRKKNASFGCHHASGTTMGHKEGLSTLGLFASTGDVEETALNMEGML